MSEGGSGPLVDERPGSAAGEDAGSEPARGLPPIAYPILAVLFGGALVWSFSRVLLAVGKDQAVAIAVLMALNILVGAALIAYGSRVRRRPVAMPFLVLAAFGIIAIGLVANFAYGDRGPEKKKEAAQAQGVTETAQGTKFLQPTLTVAPVNGKVTIHFVNRDAGTQHNIVVFNGRDAKAPQLFSGSLIIGPASTDYTFNAPPPGTYFFHCLVHPLQMTGTITLAPAGGAPTVTAQNTAFIPTKLTLTPVGGKVTIHFVDRDAGTQHNIVVFNGADATAPQLFSGDLLTGPASTDYTFNAPPPGTYFFHCLVHPLQMKGTITVS